MLEWKLTAYQTAHLSGKYLYAFPQNDTKAARHKKKADPYQPTWSRLPNSLVMRGIAVAMILYSGGYLSLPGYDCGQHTISKAIKNIGSIKAMITRESVKPLLLLGILGYGRLSSVYDLEQQVSDRKMIETTREILCRVVAEEGNSIASQSLGVLEVLSTIKFENRPNVVAKTQSGKESLRFNASVQLRSHEAQISREQLLQTVPQSASTRQNNDLTNDQTLQTIYVDMPDVGYAGPIPDSFSYLHIDIDWQNMVNADLDEDWGWNVGGI
jgi:hypothetical protein